MMKYPWGSRSPGIRSANHRAALRAAHDDYPYDAPEVERHPGFGDTFDRRSEFPPNAGEEGWRGGAIYDKMGGEDEYYYGQSPDFVQRAPPAAPMQPLRRDFLRSAMISGMVATVGAVFWNSTFAAAEPSSEPPTPAPPASKPATKDAPSVETKAAPKPAAPAPTPTAAPASKPAAEAKQPPPPPKPTAAPAPVSKPQRKDLAELGGGNYNDELMKQIEDLRERRANLNARIARDEEEQSRLLGEIKSKKERVAAVEALIQKRIEMRKELVEDISMVEEELLKITESSAKLLQTLKKKQLAFD
jgi:hypothetical protein